MSKTEPTSSQTTGDPRVLALAIWMRDREDGSSGWINTTNNHQNVLIYQASQILAVADAADPMRLAFRKMNNAE